jgi:hypothetical protein
LIFGIFETYAKSDSEKFPSAAAMIDLLEELGIRPPHLHHSVLDIWDFIDNSHWASTRLKLE